MTDVPSGLKAGVLDPQGPIAAAERLILLNATSIMLAVIVPVIIATLLIAWWFRAGNRSATRRPDWTYSGPIEVVVWGIPLLVILFLGGIAWIGSHDLAPRQALASPREPLHVQVVALDWKWLFILPEQGVASVNRLVVPAGTPLRFDITSATVMNSFFVPQLGSQIYAMAGMSTQLHLLADRPGDFPGLSAMFSGDGFSDMRFTVSALPQAGFDDWLAKARSNVATLDAAGYARLAQPGTSIATASYGRVADRLFDRIVMGNGKLAPPAGANAGLPPLFSQRNLSWSNDLCSAN